MLDVGVLLAIAAFEFDFAVVYHAEFRWDVLVVGDALRVHAACNVENLLRNVHLPLLDNFVILYDIEFCVRCHKGDFVNLNVFEKLVGDFDDGFAAQLLAWQIIAESYLTFSELVET